MSRAGTCFDPAMRVGVNTLFLIPGEVGGSETYLRETLRAIAVGHHDVQLVLFTNRENDSVLRADLAGRPDCEFQRLDFAARHRPVRILREQLELPARVRRAGVEVLWSPGYTAPLRLGAVPQVVSIHDMQYKTHPQDMTPVARVTTDLLVQAGARNCSRVLALSGFSRDEIVRFTRIDASRIAVTLAGVNPGFAESCPEDKARLATLLPDPDRPFLLAVSNTYPHKRMELAVEAFAELQSGLPHQLVLVGKARRGEPEVARAVARLERPTRYVRLESVSLPQLMALYRGAAVFLFPSAYEGFGLPVLEAIAAGTPVVAAPSASVPEVGGRLPMYVEEDRSASWAEATRKVLAWSGAERVAWRVRAQEHAQGFTWRATADRVIAALRQAVAACQRPGT